MKKLCVLILGSLLSACGNGDEEGGHSSGQSKAHSHGPHGGHLLEVGDHVAHLEVIHDEEAGKLTVYVLGPDEKTPFPLEQAPQLKLVTEQGPLVLDLEKVDQVGATFSATADVMKGVEPEGRVSLTIEGKVYNPILEHEH